MAMYGNRSLNSLLSAEMPVQGNLAEAIGYYLPMGGGKGEAQFPPPPPGGFAPQAAPSYSGSSFLDPENAMPVAAALLQGKTFGDSLGGAFAAFGEVSQRRKAKDALKSMYPELAAIADAGAPIDALWKSALDKKNRNLVNAGDGRIYDADSGQWITAPGAEESLFEGNSVEAQSLNGLVKSGALTREQALQLGAGKVVTNPADGSLMFMTPQGIFSKPANGGEASPVQPNAPSGGIPLTGPKPEKPTESQRNRVSQVSQAVQAVNDALDRYQQLVDKTGLSVVPGKDQDNLKQVRQGIMLQLKELFNLGVLNGPDLMLMENMIYNPVVDGEGGYTSLLGQGLTSLGIGGDAATRSRNSVSELKRMLTQIEKSVMDTNPAAPGAGGAEEEWVRDPATGKLMRK